MRDLASRQTTVVESARMFALTNLALADTLINTWHVVTVQGSGKLDHLDRL